MNKKEELRRSLIDLNHVWGIDYSDLDMWDYEDIRNNLENLQMDISLIIDNLLDLQEEE